MIYKYEVQLKKVEKFQFLNSGSIFQGIIMNNINSDIAESLHHNFKYSPLKQRVYFKGDDYVWEIVSFNDDLSYEINQFLLKNSNVYLKKHDETVTFKSYSTTKINTDDWIKDSLNNVSQSRFKEIEIISPMSFKSNGQYMIFPDVRKVFRSLMLQFNELIDDYDMYDLETLNYIEEHVKIVDYKLKSCKFHLEGVKIPSFIGRVTFKVSGSSNISELVFLLLKFGELSGIGIKTSIGMGKINVLR